MKTAVICGLVLLATPLLLTVAETTSAATIHVPGDQPTIQAGIDAASPGDIILVAAGSYTGAGNKNLTFDGKDVVLLSEDGPSVTIIDLEGVGRGIHLTGGETLDAVIDGFTVRNSSTHPVDAFAIRLESSSATIRDCIVEDNPEGGILCDGADAVLEDCLMRGATGVNSAVRTRNNQLTVTRCTFENNNVTTSPGIEAYGATVIISESNFETNDGTSTGAIEATNSEFFISDSNFLENQGTGAGVISASGTTINIEDCRILGCRGTSAGVFNLYNSPCTMLRTIVAGCRGTSGNLVLASSSVTTFEHCTIASNRGTGPGAITVIGTDLYLTRTIVWGNCYTSGGEINADATSSVTLECCAFRPEEIHGPGQIILIGEQVNTDPLFCDPRNCDDAPTIAGEYTLDSRSPCTAANSPCGERIGLYGIDCGPPVAVESMTWGGIKSSYAN